MNKVRFAMLIVCASMLFTFTGCAGFTGMGPGGVSRGTITADNTYPGVVYQHTQVQLTSKDFEILQTVTAEVSSSNMLGLFSTGDNGYAELYKKACKIGADDVINVKVDTRTVSFLSGFYTSADTKLMGTAIRWKKESK